MISAKTANVKRNEKISQPYFSKTFKFKTMNKIIIIVLLLASTLSISAQDKSRKERKAEKEAQRMEEVQNLLNSGKLKFKADYALPMGSTSIYLNSTYDLILKNDSAFAWLPYYGVAYQADYGGREGGIKFKEPIKKYKIKDTSSGKDVSFRVKSKKDTYDMVLSISDNGNADLNVTCIKRQPIRFTGSIHPIDEE